MMSTAKYLLGLWVMFWVVATLAGPVPLPDSPPCCDSGWSRSSHATARADSQGSFPLPELLQQFYAQRDYQPAWLNAAGPCRRPGTCWNDQ